MSLRYGVLSLLAFLIILALSFKNYEVRTLPIEITPEKGVAKKSDAKIETPPATAPQSEIASIQSFIFVAEKNIFSPERKEFPVVPAPSSKEQEKKPIVRPQIILYGVTIAGQYKSASIANPGRPLQRGEREIMTLKIGDPIGEYKLTNILPDRITLGTQEDNFEVLLYDAKTPKKRVVVRTENKPATIISTLPAPTPPPTPAGAPGAPVTPGTAPITAGVAPTRGPAALSAAPTSPPTHPPAGPPGPSGLPRRRTWGGPKGPGEE